MRLDTGWSDTCAVENISRRLQVNRYVIAQHDCDIAGDLGVVRSDSMSPEAFIELLIGSSVRTWPPETL
jgi:hypothetical protein